MAASRHPNLLFVFGDQWRGQAVGYRGDANARTPAIDRFAAESIDLVNAVAGTPVCCPYRATLMTGQHPLTHGVFVNDVCITSDAVPLAECLHRGGYDTAYIGKWHIDGQGRQVYVPPERRLGFRYWRGFECTHDYNASDHYADDPRKLRWEGYDAEAQTRLACDLIRARRPGDRPFALFLSWGPPHNPFHTAPERFRRNYAPESIHLRPNVPESLASQARTDLAGYYAHIEALDTCFAGLLDALRDSGSEEETLVVFTSDHGEMLGSQGLFRKQKPWDESVCVPFLLRCPSVFGREGRQLDLCMNAPDIMPTLLDLCGLDIPPTVQGRSAAAAMRGETPRPGLDAALLALHFPFHEWNLNNGGKEYRGLRTARHTYCRDLAGPWLLYDNAADPFQMRNLVDAPEVASLQRALDARLQAELAAIGDAFLPGTEYVARRGVQLNERRDITIYPDRGPYAATV